MGQIAIQLAVELIYKIKEKIRKKKTNKVKVNLNENGDKKCTILQTISPP